MTNETGDAGEEGPARGLRQRHQDPGRGARGASGARPRPAAGHAGRIRPAMWACAAIVLVRPTSASSSPTGLFPNAPPPESVAVQEAEPPHRHGQRCAAPRALPPAERPAPGHAGRGRRAIRRQISPRAARRHRLAARSASTAASRLTLSSDRAAAQVPRQQLRSDLAEDAMKRDRARLHLHRAAGRDDRDRPARGLGAAQVHRSEAPRPVRPGASRTWRRSGSPATAPGTRPAPGRPRPEPARSPRRSRRTSPSSFSFAKPDYTLDWENFVPPGGGPSGGMQLGVVLTSTQRAPHAAPWRRTSATRRRSSSSAATSPS